MTDGVSESNNAMRKHEEWIREQYENSRFEIVDVSRYRGRIYIIVKVNTSVNDFPTYNGYVSLKEHKWWHRGSPYKDYTDYESLADDGLTYCGYFGKEWKDKVKSHWFMDIPENLFFFGFDTLHAWNREENASYEAVRRKTLKLADRMIKRRI